jgi:hypothetical protein
MDEHKAFINETRNHLRDVFDNYCKDPSWRPGANDFEILFNSMASSFQAIAPLLTIAVNSLQINDESRKNLKQEVDFSFEFNSFLTMFKQAAEENFNNNALQIQTTLEMVNSIGQNLSGIINEVFINFEKLNLEYGDQRKNAAEVLELKIYLAAGKQFMDSLRANEENILSLQGNQIAELAKIFSPIPLSDCLVMTRCFLHSL